MGGNVVVLIVSMRGQKLCIVCSTNKLCSSFCTLCYMYDCSVYLLACMLNMTVHVAQ